MFECPIILIVAESRSYKGDRCLCIYIYIYIYIYLFIHINIYCYIFATTHIVDLFDMILQALSLFLFLLYHYSYLFFTYFLCIYIYMFPIWRCFNPDDIYLYCHTIFYTIIYIAIFAPFLRARDFRALDFRCMVLIVLHYMDIYILIYIHIY
jgi:hypothetical protein